MDIHVIKMFRDYIYDYFSKILIACCQVKFKLINLALHFLVFFFHFFFGGSGRFFRDFLK